jgi:hypothetical protein
MKIIQKHSPNIIFIIIVFIMIIIIIIIIIIVFIMIIIIIIIIIIVFIMIIIIIIEVIVVINVYVAFVIIISITFVGDRGFGVIVEFNAVLSSAMLQKRSYFPKAFGKLHEFVNENAFFNVAPGPLVALGDVDFLKNIYIMKQ